VSDPIRAMSHEELRKAAVRWLTNAKHCGVVLSEMQSAAQEVPDAIGWNAGFSILIECKASRSDFLRNEDKCVIRSGGGMGRQRYFLCPARLIRPEDLDDSDYGLLWLQESGHIRVAVEAPVRETDERGEIRMLVSALRRVRTREFLTLNVLPTEETPPPEQLAPPADPGAGEGRA
jgi:hypothetical protein